MSDSVFLRRIRLTAAVGLDCWQREKPQPVELSLQLPANLQQAGETDDVANTINYGTLYKKLSKALDGSSYKTLDAFAEAAARIGLKLGGGIAARATAKLPKVLFQAVGGEGGVAVEVAIAAASEDASTKVQSKVLRVENLRLACIIGVNDHERTAKQIVVLNLDLHDGPVPEMTNYHGLFIPLIKYVEESTYLTLEALCWSVIKLVLMLGFPKVTVSAEKPNAFGLVDCPGVVMTRSRLEVPEDDPEKHKPLLA